MRFFIFPSFLLSIFSCSTSPDYSGLISFSLDKREELTLDGLIPKTYLISSKLAQKGDTLYYWDSTKSQIILLNSSFQWIGSLLDGTGNGPREISFYAGHNLVEGQFFILGEKAVVYDAKTHEYVGKYRLPTGDISWVQYFAGRYVMGGLLYEENRYVLYSSLFDRDEGFTDIREELTIDFPERLDELSMTAMASIMDNYLYVLKTDLGELVKINPNFEIEYDVELPMGIGRMKNLEQYEDGLLDTIILETWDFIVHEGKIYVLRFSNLPGKIPVRNELTRKTIHIYDASAAPIGVITLPEKAWHISFINDLLCTTDHKDETCFFYEILD